MDREPKVSKRPADPMGVGSRVREPGKENRYASDILEIAKRIERKSIARRAARKAKQDA